MPLGTFPRTLLFSGVSAYCFSFLIDPCLPVKNPFDNSYLWSTSSRVLIVSSRVFGGRINLTFKDFPKSKSCFSFTKSSSTLLNSSEVSFFVLSYASDSVGFFTFLSNSRYSFSSCGLMASSFISRRVFVFSVGSLADGTLICACGTLFLIAYSVFSSFFKRMAFVFFFKDSVVVEKKLLLANKSPFLMAINLF